MNKKTLALVAIVALGIGGVSAIAVQSHAQQVLTQLATTSTVQSTSTQDISSPSDIDNIQDGETNDDATSTIGQKKDTKEPGEGTATDATEVEDAN